MLELKSPISIVWEITNNCNFKCPHCRAYQKITKDDEKTENRIIEEIIKNDILTVNISGGEPLLNARIFDIIERLTKANVYVGISTNGWLYKEKREKLLKAGLKFVQVSLDGKKELHEKFRGVEGSFDRAVETLKLAKEDGLFTQMNVTITSENLQTLEWNYDKALEIGVNKILYRRVVPAGKAIENRYILPDKKQYHKILRKLISLDNSKLNVAVDDPIIYALQDIKGKENLGCAAGIKSLGISSEGNVYPCIFLREKLGNINQKSLKDIWNHSLVLKRLRNKEIDGCRDCEYWYTCGGCRAASGIFEKDEMCPLEQLEEEKICQLV